MQKKKSIFQKYPGLLLLLLNIFFICITGLIFVIGIGIAIGENYHPDSVSRSLIPTIFAILIVSILSLLLSFLAWFRWHYINKKYTWICLVLHIFILTIIGSTTYLLTEKNPEYRTYEHLGFTYKIPREYSPSKFWEDNLSIKVCGNNPLFGKYDRTAWEQVIESCEQEQHVIEPLLQGYTTTSGDIFKRELINGKHGFTIATTDDALVLASIDAQVLEEGRGEKFIEDGKVIFRSTDGGLHKNTFHLEFVDNVLQWMTVCNLWDCRNYSRFPDNEDYVLRFGVYNKAQYERGFLTDEEIEVYKVLFDNVYELFKSFRIN